MRCISDALYKVPCVLPVCVLLLYHAYPFVSDFVLIVFSFGSLHVCLRTIISCVHTFIALHLKWQRNNDCDNFQ